MSQAIAVLKVVQREWISRDGATVPDGPSFSPQWPAVLAGELHDKVVKALTESNIDIDETSSCNDWVDVIQTIDDRKSVLQPGTYIIVTEDGRLSTVYGASQVDIDAEGQAVITFE
jgi:hypothetical protein